MGRSSAGQAQKNRAMIVKAASDLFRERGVEAVSVADVMAQVSMTVGGFYRHFESKEALVAEAAAHAFDDAGAIWAEMLGQSADGGAGQRARLVAHYLRPDPQRHCPIIAFAPHAASRDSEASARMTYDTGAGALLGTFLGFHEGDGGAANPARVTPDALLLFAAMIGARVLAEAAGDVGWVSAVKGAVMDAAAGD